MRELKLHTPLDRDYFKYKDNPRKRKTRLTDCCGKDEDHKLSGSKITTDMIFILKKGYNWIYLQVGLCLRQTRPAFYTC